MSKCQKEKSIKIIEFSNLWKLFQMYIWVRVAIFLPIVSIVKTLFIAFFNGTF